MKTPNKIKEEKCVKCQFEDGKHSLECPNYIEPKNPMNQIKEEKWLKEFEKILPYPKIDKELMKTAKTFTEIGIYDQNWQMYCKKWEELKSFIHQKIQESFELGKRKIMEEIERFIKDEKYDDRDDYKTIASFRGKDKIKMNEDMIKGYNIALKDLEELKRKLKN